MESINPTNKEKIHPTVTRNWYGKILTVGGAIDWKGRGINIDFLSSPENWRTPIVEPKVKLTSDRKIDIPLTFSSVPTGRPYEFALLAKLKYKENLWWYLSGEDSIGGMARKICSTEYVDIYGTSGGVFPYTGFDIFGLIKNPALFFDEDFFGTESQVFDDRCLPRFVLKTAKNDDKDDSFVETKTEHIVESFGFPKLYSQSQDYFALAAKTISLLKQNPANHLIAINGGFDLYEHTYDNALMKLEFVRFIHDLYGKWFHFSTSPDLGKFVLYGLTFTGPEFLEEGAGYIGKPEMLHEVNFLADLALNSTETMIRDIIIEHFKSPNLKDQPSLTYKEVQKKISSIN